MEKTSLGLAWGCVADDFTGASDVASFFKKGGLRTILYTGIPKGGINPGFDAAVIALKTRTEETGAAVEESMRALRWLKDQGAAQLYVKYCSTFDSTPHGNIGPIADAALEAFGGDYTLLCPALPINGRTVEGGILYVNGVPLAESPMKDHPLTPMWDSCISALMAPQSRYPCEVLSREQTVAPSARLRELERLYDRFYLVPDCSGDRDLDAIAASFGDLPLLTGGSGLAEALARASSRKAAIAVQSCAVPGRALILAGSCSQATIGQIRHFVRGGGSALQMYPAALQTGRQSAQSLFKEALRLDGPLLIYSSDNKENVRKNQLMGAEQVSALLETTAAELARMAVEHGFARIIVAGGETSGAVTRGLGCSAYEIGPSVAPGVPIMTPIERPGLRLVLKSGNFGSENFFKQALDMTGA